MSDDDLAIGQKLRTTYFRVLFCAFAALIGIAVYYFTAVTHAFRHETALVMIWVFFFCMVAWLLVDYLSLSLRSWMGWLERRPPW